MILSRCEHVNSIKEVEPVGMSGQVEGQFIGLSEIPIGIKSLGQWACDKRSTVHLCEIWQVETYLYGVTTVHGIVDCITLYLLARHEGDLRIAIKRNGRMVYINLGEYDWFRSCQVGETET